MFDLGIFADYFSPIILIACLCVGYVIKAVWQSEKINRFIPLIVMVLGLILNVWFEASVALPVIVAGMVSGLASTGLYELVDTTILNLGKVCENLNTPKEKEQFMNDNEMEITLADGEEVSEETFDELSCGKEANEDAEG